MNVLRFLGVILMTWSIAVHAAGPSVDSDDAAGGVLSGTAWTLVALAGQPIDPAALVSGAQLRLALDAALMTLL